MPVVGPMTLNLSKLSYTADIPPDLGAQHYDWKHIHNGLAVVFDNFRVAGSPCQAMRILQGTQVLYDIDIERLIGDGLELIERLARHGAEVRCDQLPISAIVKCPLLALRYSLPREGKVRRIQLRFATPQEYDTAVNHLRQLGLRMTVPAKCGSSTGPSRPQSGGPSCPPSRLSEISDRPLTAIPPTAPFLQGQIGEAVVARPISAMAAQIHPLVPPVYFPRPDSGSTVSIDRIMSEKPFNRPSTSEANLPPRRELPFARPDIPRSSGSDTARPVSRSSGAMGPPPLPPPSRAGNKRPDSRDATSHDTGMSDQSISAPIQNDPSSPPYMTGSNQGFSRGTDATCSKPAVPEDRENRAPMSSPLPFQRETGDGSFSRRPTSPFSKVQGHQPASKFAGSLLSPPGSDATCPLQDQRRAEEIQSLTSNAAQSLTEYAMQSDERRADALNSFILQHLDDDCFLALVEDMNMCWARIAPGLG